MTIVVRFIVVLFRG